METGSKKHVIAERWIDSGIPLNLCNLFVSSFDRFKVLYLASSLSKNLLGYKILIDSENLSDEWLNSNEILNVYHCDFNPDFELIPEGFSQNRSSNHSGFVIESSGKTGDNDIHILSGIAEHFKELNQNAVYFNTHGGIITVAVFNGRNCLLANSFACTDHTEMLYYTLSVIKAANISQTEVDVYMDYNAWNNESLRAFFEPYFRDILPLVIPGENPDEALADLPSLLFSAYAISLCA